MPTYVCSVPAGSLTITQKTAIAEAIARVHSEATGAPQFFVQVIIDENQSVDRFLGGQLTTNHIWIRGDIRAGRTEEQRKKLMFHIMRDVSQIAGVNEDSIDLVENYIRQTIPASEMEKLRNPGGLNASPGTPRYDY